MNSDFFINGHRLKKTKIGVNKYMISIFNLEKFDFQFAVSLQPIEKNMDHLPTFQLADKSKVIPLWVENQMNDISSWIEKENEDDYL